MTHSFPTRRSSDLIGALLDCDGDFGSVTEGAVKEAQQRAGLPATGIADAATWAWLEAQPEPSDSIPVEAVTFIVTEEVGGRQFYDRHVAMPHFPGVARDRKSTRLNSSH